MEIIGFTFETIGKILVAYAALRVHYRFRKEHKVDRKVFSTMHKEQVIGVIGIALIILGYVIQIPFKI